MNTNQSGEPIATTRRLPSLMAAALLAVSAVPLQAGAATVSLCGSSICYEYDASQAGLALFGTPAVIGDVLRFLPTAFLASSPNAPDTALLSATFVIDRIYALSGAALQTISVTETGDYRTRNAGGISASVSLLATSNPATGSTQTTASLEAVSPSGGVQIWNLTATLAVGDDFIGFPGATRDMALTIQNTLEAFGGGGSFAQKKAIFVNVAAVPIPAAGFLLVPAFFALRHLARPRTADGTARRPS